MAENENLNGNQQYAAPVMEAEQPTGMAVTESETAVTGSSSTLEELPAEPKLAVPDEVRKFLEKKTRERLISISKNHHVTESASQELAEKSVSNGEETSVTSKSEVPSVTGEEAPTSLDFNTIEDEVLIDKLTEIKGIKEKTALYLMSQIQFLRDAGVKFESAADFQEKLWGIGKVKANALATAFNLPEVISEDIPDTAEQIDADAQDLDERAEQFHGGWSIFVSSIGTVARNVGAASTGLLEKVAAKSQRLRERFATSKASESVASSSNENEAVRLTNLEAAIKEGNQEEALRLLAEIKASSNKNLETDTQVSPEYNLEESPKPQPEFQLVEEPEATRFLDKLNLTKLSERQKKVLSGIAVASGASGLALAALLTFADLRQQSDQIASSLTEYVSKLPSSAVIAPFNAEPSAPQSTATADILRVVPEATVAPSTDTLQPVATIAPPPTADILKPVSEVTTEPPTKPSLLDRILGRKNNIKAPEIDIAPQVAPGVVNEAPLTPPVGSQIKPTAENAFQAPATAPMYAPNYLPDNLQTNGQSEEDNKPQVNEKIMPITPNYVPDNLQTNGLWPKSESLSPSSSEASSQAPNEKSEASELTQVEGGILDTWCNNIIDEQRDTVNPDAKNVCKNLVKKMNPDLVWTALPDDADFDEILTIDELKKPMAAGAEGWIIPNTAVLKIYDAAVDPDSVQDPNIKSILQSMMRYEITDQNMSESQKMALLEFGLEQPAETE